MKAFTCSHALLKSAAWRMLLFIVKHSISSFRLRLKTDKDTLTALRYLFCEAFGDTTKNLAIEATGGNFTIVKCYASKNIVNILVMQ